MPVGMILFRKLFWVAIFVVATLSFIVLFEHGSDHFGTNLTKQLGEMRTFVEGQIHPKKEKKPEI